MVIPTGSRKPDAPHRPTRWQNVAFPVPFDCKQKAMKYIIHGGWGNQVAGLQRALLLANLLNRTLIVPPVLKHSELAYGTCPASAKMIKARGATPDQMRQKGEHHFSIVCGNSGTSALDVFDGRVLEESGRTVGWAQWQRQCSGQVDPTSQIQTVEHDCSDKRRWEVPADVRENQTTHRLINEAWRAAPDAGGASVDAEWGESISMLRKSEKTLLHFSSLFSYTLYSDSYFVILN